MDKADISRQYKLQNKSEDQEGDNLNQNNGQINNFNNKGVVAYNVEYNFYAHNAKTSPGLSALPSNVQQLPSVPNYTGKGDLTSSNNNTSRPLVCSSPENVSRSASSSNLLAVLKKYHSPSTVSSLPMASTFPTSVPNVSALNKASSSMDAVRAPDRENLKLGDTKASSNSRKPTLTSHQPNRPPKPSNQTSSSWVDNRRDTLNSSVPNSTSLSTNIWEKTSFKIPNNPWSNTSPKDPSGAVTHTSNKRTSSTSYIGTVPPVTSSYSAAPPSRTVSHTVLPGTGSYSLPPLHGTAPSLSTSRLTKKSTDYRTSLPTSMKTVRKSSSATALQGTSRLSTLNTNKPNAVTSLPTSMKTVRKSSSTTASQGTSRLSTLNTNKPNAATSYSFHSKTLRQ